MVVWSKLGAVDAEQSLWAEMGFTGCPDGGRMTSRTALWFLKLFIWKWHVNTVAAPKSQGHANFNVIGKNEVVFCAP